MTLYVVIGWHHNGATPRLYGTGSHGDEAFHDRDEASGVRDRLSAAHGGTHFTVHPLGREDASE